MYNYHSKGYRCARSQAPARNFKITEVYGLFEVVRDCIVYKRVWRSSYRDTLKMILPAGAIVRLSMSSSRKCRASFMFIPDYEGATVYGQENYVYPKNDFTFPKNRFSISDKECAGGIHFFFNKLDADNYPC